nr:cation-dependent mannose-6-phosphate receptor-like [Pocillopora verrucosa]
MYIKIICFIGIKDDKQSTYSYNWNPCTPFSSSSGCKDTLLCQKVPNKYYAVATAVSSFDENSDGSINITYKPVISSLDYTRKAIIVLKCDQSQDRGKFSPFHEDDMTTSKKSLYTATFSTKYACIESGGRGGLSTGSILLIVFFSLVLIYFIAGLLYNKIHKGVSSFPEMIPNHSFWGDFPFLVKDGCVFTFQGIAGCCKRLSMKVTGDSYAEI